MGAIFLALPQYNIDIIGVLLLVWLQKDTNCQSELKPQFINTGIHMFTSCNIVLICPLTKVTLKLLYITKQYDMIHWSSSNKDMNQKRQTTLNGTKAHSEFLIAHSQLCGITEQHRHVSLNTCLLSTHFC